MHTFSFMSVRPVSPLLTGGSPQKLLSPRLVGFCLCAFNQNACAVYMNCDFVRQKFFFHPFPALSPLAFCLPNSFHPIPLVLSTRPSTESVREEYILSTRLLFSSSPVKALIKVEGNLTGGRLSTDRKEKRERVVVVG
mmetsp:Transcript_12335/g.23925  ORF Transcript_12335/g.23925 Transcript_12335/m.23925 type:complete len:138 (-) Transcript_12335:2035-2448(-)